MGIMSLSLFYNLGLSRNAMTKMAKKELGRISNIYMYSFIEKGMKGCISYIAKRYNKANNKCMQSYNESKPSKHIMHLDLNNLYGRAMSQYFPSNGFEGLDKKVIKKFDAI